MSLLTSQMSTTPDLWNQVKNCVCSDSKQKLLQSADNPADSSLYIVFASPFKIFIPHQISDLTSTNTTNLQALSMSVSCQMEMQ